jgi:hypothetical protein
MDSFPPSPETTLAIILGASEFPKQPNLVSTQAFLNSAKAFREYLLNSSGLGITAENVLDLFDSDDSAPDMDEKVGNFLEERQQNLSEQNQKARDLLVYYVGHGGFSSPGDEYFLAIRKTHIRNEGPSSYGIKALANTLRENATHLRRYLILDSCFAAAAYSSFQSAPLEIAKRQTLLELPPKGTALLCAAGPKDPAKTLPTQLLTMFSEAFLEALRVGDPQITGKLSFRDVSEITRSLIKTKFPNKAIRPEMLSPDQRQGDLATTPFFPNATQSAKSVIEINISSLPVAWPVSDPDYVWPLADRTKEFKLFDKMITGRSKRRILLLRGLSNTGKTACISELATYTQHLRVINALLDFKGTPSFDELFEMLRLDLGPDVLRRAINGAPSARFLELISDLQQLRVPLVLFFDTYQQASAEAQRWLENKFLRRIDRAPSVITVIGGQTVPSHETYNWHQWTELRNLQPIKVEDWMDYVRRKWKRTDVKIEYVKALTWAAEGVPGRISALLETMMLELEQESGD